MQMQSDLLKDLVDVRATRSAASKTLSAPRPWSGSRASFLAEASKRLAASLDRQTTVRSMTELAVPELGTACMVCLFSDDLSISEVTTRHTEPHRELLMTELARPPYEDQRAWNAVLTAGRSRRSVVLSQLSTAVLLGGAKAPHAVLGELGLKTALLVPVVNRQSDNAMGVVVFLSERTRHYGARQLRLAEDLVGRFALALEAAEMYRSCQILLDTRQETLATTVHDMMSPLTYIKGTAQRLRRLEQGVPDDSARAEFRQRLEAIDSAANRMACALTALLQSTGPQAGDWPARPCQAADLVDMAVRVVSEHQLIARDHSIHIGEAPQSLPGTWDSNRVERMLSNLIGNAVKYSPPATVVEVSLAREADADGCWAVVRVSDQGMGIPAGDLPFVFEPFQRGRNVGKIVGSGLGLASVWQTVKTHDGRLWIDSEEGKGTRVTVRLPLEAQIPSASS